MKKQSGQVIVEFALVLPLFLLLLFGIFYSGMLFHDYSTLSNIARSAAREAAVSSGTEYGSISSHYSTQGLLTSLYTQQNFEILKGKNDSDPNEVYVKITMARNVDFPLIGMLLPEDFAVVYFMKKDLPSSSGG